MKACEHEARSGCSRDVAATFQEIRRFTEQLSEPLEPADFEAQSMADTSPAKWHLAHTSWFFETFVLAEFEPGFVAFHPQYRSLFNSYYDAVGLRHERARRGLLTRPSLERVFEYRQNVTGRVLELLNRTANISRDAQRLIELGCHHEQQHQELLLTDVKHLFSCNPMNPAYRAPLDVAREAAGPAGAPCFQEFDGGVREVGHVGEGFAFDNEGPRHRVYLEPFRLSTRLVTNQEFAAFIADGGYRRSELWLDAGYRRVVGEGWDKPLYWRGTPGAFAEFTLAGEREFVPGEPVSHVSYYEADAFARWAGARLPREEEWEVACRGCRVEGNFVETGRCHPEPTRPASLAEDGLTQCFGDLWEWTQSAYSPYPGYQRGAGALGEYNGKFMCEQLVLRGGSCVTSRSHIRPTYRNFFFAKDRWQFSGIRLAKDASC